MWKIVNPHSSKKCAKQGTRGNNVNDEHFHYYCCSDLDNGIGSNFYKCIIVMHYAKFSKIIYLSAQESAWDIFGLLSSTCGFEKILMFFSYIKN